MLIIPFHSDQSFTETPIHLLAQWFWYFVCDIFLSSCDRFISSVRLKEILDCHLQYHWSTTIKSFTEGEQHSSMHVFKYSSEWRGNHRCLWITIISAFLFALTSLNLHRCYRCCDFQYRVVAVFSALFPEHSNIKVIQHCFVTFYTEIFQIIWTFCLLLGFFCVFFLLQFLSFLFQKFCFDERDRKHGE